MSQSTTTNKSIQTLISDFETLAQNFPTITSIKPQNCSQYPATFRVNYLTPNYRESSFHNTTHHFSFNPSSESPIQKLTEFPTVEPFIAAESYSPSRNFKAILRVAPEKTLLEIWGKTGLQRTLKVSDYHGVIYTDLEFTIDALTWSQDEKRIAYIAEKRPPRVPKLFENFNSEDEAKGVLRNFAYTDDFGEMYRGKSNPGVFIYEIVEDSLYSVVNIPEGIIPTQISFTTKEGSAIVFCGYHFKGIKYGIKFSANRECKIYHLGGLALRTIKGNSKKKLNPEESKAQEEKLRNDIEIYKPVKITNEDITLAPVVSKDLTKLIYLYAPHKRTILLVFGIKMIDLTSKEFTTTVVFEPPKEKNPEFYGINTYQNRLTRMRFLGDTNYFVFNCYDRNALALFIGNTDTKEIKRIDKTPFKSGECRFEAAENGLIFAILSNISNERTFGVLSGLDTTAKTVAEAIKNLKWDFYELNPEKTPQLIPTANNSLTNLPEIEEKILTVRGAESAFFTLKDGSTGPKPLIMFIHGGPHGISTGFFTMMMYYALYRGYNVVYPNYSGSSGFGQEFIDSLPGKVGDLDAEDIRALMEYCCENGLADRKRLICVGLSYGGFLTGVLISKHPELFKCAVLQNPAISMVNMYEASDVPDWPLAEVLNIDVPQDVTGDMYKKMFQASPLGMSKEIRSKVLLLLGDKDKRIPSGPALLYYKLLKDRGVDIQLALYPNDEHVLNGTPDSIADQFVRTFAFIDEKLES